MSGKMKEITFKRIDDEAWKKAALQSLRGKPFEQLRTEKIEGITQHPLYTKQSYDTYFENNAVPFVQKIRGGMLSSSWKIAQETFAETSSSFVNQLKEGLKNGNEVVRYTGVPSIKWEQEDLKEIANIITEYPIHVFCVKPTDGFLQVFDMIPREDRKRVTGVVPNISLPEGYTQIKRVCISSIDEHYEGADIVTELAITLGKIVQATDKTQSFEELADTLAVQFAVDTDFFMEMAKFRAFRVLWHTLSRSYETDIRKIPILAETSLRSYTKYDAQTNMLRAGNETLAAVLGGIDIFTVHPHLILQEMTNASIRTARNIQLVIREEAFMKYVLDPAGGSYYIDTITDELVQASWRLFQEIESVGGIEAYIQAGKLHKLLQKRQEQRVGELNNGKKSLIGTTRYADPEEQLIQGTSIINPSRLAGPYEYIRERLQIHSPKTVLLRFGTLASCKANVDLVKGFLAVGGISPEESPIFKDIREANNWINTNTYDLYIICIPYHEGLDTIKGIDIRSNMRTAMIGTFDTEAVNELKEMGISNIFDANGNRLEQLKLILQNWEGGNNNE